MTTRCLYLAAALSGVLAACQDQAQRETAPPPPAAIQVKDGAGNAIAEMRTSRPCRAVIGGNEMIVGGPPLISTLGTTKWTGESLPNGTVISRDGERIARVFPVGDPKGSSVIDMHGVALARIAVTGDVATVSDAASVPVRTLTRAAHVIVSHELNVTVTGTEDLVLAALLTAPELLPEVRALAACERVLAKGS